MSVRFDASGDSYSATTSLPASSTMSYVAWVRIAVDRNDFSEVVSFGPFGSTYCGLGAAADGTTVGLFDSSNYSSTALGATAFTVGTWYAVGVVISGANATIYRGAAGSALTSTSVSNFTFSAPTTLRLGDYIDAGFLWNGNLAGFKLWQAALTQAEIENELRQYAPDRVANLLHFHPFVRAETTDYSGNGAALTGGSGATTEDGPPIPWRGEAPRLILPPASGNATAAPAVTSTTVAVPQVTPSAGSTKTPAVTTAVVAAPQATPSVSDAGTPASISAVVALPQASVSVAATVSPSAVAAVVGLPQATPVTSGNAIVTPAPIAVVAAVPQTAVSVATGPAALTATVALPQATPQTAGNATVTPASVSAAIGVPAASPSGAAAASPAVLAAVAALPQASPIAGGNVTTNPSPVAVVAGLPAALPQAGVVVTPGVLVTVAAVPRPAVGVSVGPSSIAVLAALPSAVPATTSSVTRSPATIVTVVAVPHASAFAEGEGVRGQLGELSARLPGGVVASETFESGGTIR